jgi:peptidoglycan/LPS O-acetylase OafA/YrhL
MGAGSCEGNESSRDSKERAGWRVDGRPTGWARLVEDRLNPRWSEFSWLAVRSLLDSANDTIAKSIHDLVNARRMRWMAAQRAAGADPRLRTTVIEPSAERLSFLLVGDPGEADGSQYALVGNGAKPRPGTPPAGPLQAAAAETDFMLLASDVIYPAGDVNDYENAVFLPYWWYDKPILGQPGNHDWYDGLNGFMWHFCGAEPLPPLEYRPGSFTGVERLARQLWRKASRPNRVGLLGWRSKLQSRTDYADWTPPQPGPYFSIECRDLKILVVDNGITGTIDREQAEWLLRESEGKKHKLLITGKPIYVNGKYEPGAIIWNEDQEDEERRQREGKPPLHPKPVPDRGYQGTYATVDDIVRDVDRNFVAAIGGDTHNYQRYTVRIRPKCRPDEQEEERKIEYIVSGGAGAYLTETHTIRRIDMRPGHTKRLPEEVQAVGEGDFHCYPLRGDSVAYYVEPLGRFVRAWTWRSFLALLAVVGAALALFLGDERDIHGLAVGWAILAIPATVIALGLVGALAILAGRRAPPGYGAFVALCSGAALLLFALLALEQATWWDDAWVFPPVTVGLLLAAVAAVLVGYYTRGSSPRFLGDLVVVLVVAAAGMALAGWEPWATTEKALLTAAALLAVIVAVVPPLGALRRHRERGRSYRRFLVYGGLALAGVGVWQGWDEWLVRAAVVAAGVIVLLLVAVFLLRFARAMKCLVSRDFANPASRADAILALVHQRFGLEALPGRPPESASDRRAERLVDLILPTADKPFLGGFISKAADRNDAPFFKQFLRIDVAHGHLTIKCLGVTGWAEDASDPPVEDCVGIPLT